MKKVSFVISVVVVVALFMAGTKEKAQSSSVPECNCSNPDGKVGDYKCIDGKEYRCKEDVTDVCSWKLTNRSCGEK